MSALDVSTQYFKKILNTLVDRARDLRVRIPAGPPAAGEAVAVTANNLDQIKHLLTALMSKRGEASGIRVAKQILQLYRMLSPPQKAAYFEFLAKDFDPDAAKLNKAWQVYQQEPTAHHLKSLREAVEPPRQELLRRLNQAPQATASLVAMRKDLLHAALPSESRARVDNDFVHLFQSWFNRGFLLLRRVDWSSPADLLERVMGYEAVHAVQGWPDLRRRLAPADRRCYAFFHPALGDEPLIFVEIALANGVLNSIQNILAPDRPSQTASEPTSAIFYSISHCQDGLRGISFGDFLIKQVVEELSAELPSLNTFATLSPVPGLMKWIRELQNDAVSDAEGLQALRSLKTSDAFDDPQVAARLRPLLISLACRYLLEAKADRGEPRDSVARFHLRNGALLERINWLADTSAKGIAESAGIMVNYKYDLKLIEENHERYTNDRHVAASPEIRRLHAAAVQGGIMEAPAPDDPSVSGKEDRAKTWADLFAPWKAKGEATGR